MFAATAALSGVLAFVLGAGAIGKWVKMKTQVDTASKLNIAWNRYQLIAVPEAAGALGLLAGLVIAPLGVAAAAGAVALMAGALTFRVRAHDTVMFLAGDATLLLLAGATVTLRALTA